MIGRLTGQCTMHVCGVCACVCVCTFWANKSQTSKQTNKLATEIGNSRMPFSITLASDQRAAADTAHVKERGGAEKTKATDERGGGAAAEASTEAAQVEVGYGQCLHSLRSATFITYAYACECLCECALSVCAYVCVFMYSCCHIYAFSGNADIFNVFLQQLFTSLWPQQQQQQPETISIALQHCQRHKVFTVTKSEELHCSSIRAAQQQST